MSARYDLILVGGGLANGLLLFHLRQTRPEWSVLLLERESALGGNHTWSFHETDVSASAGKWLLPLVTGRWDHYDVKFPRVARRLSSAYFSIRSEEFHSALLRDCAQNVRLSTSITEVGANQVKLASGETLTATAVLDGRGFGPEQSPAGYQTFFGQDLKLSAPHGLRAPLLMDATCEQRGGFRFFYLLPWSADTLLVEDTRYTDFAAVDAEECRQEIAAYVKARGWQVRSVEREEMAALPIPLSAPRLPETAAIAVGVRAGLFHATTGYSLPDAVRVAELVAKAPTPEAIRGLIVDYRRQHERQQRYFRFLNRMLFKGAAPSERYRLLQRFYRMPTGTIGRFYAGTMKPWDGARVLIGKPPIPLRSALQCLFENGVPSHQLRIQEKTA